MKSSKSIKCTCLKLHLHFHPHHAFESKTTNHKKKTYEKNERGTFTLGCTHTCSDSWWKSRGVGSGWWCGQLWCQEGSGSSHRKETETIKRAAVSNNSLSRDHSRSQEETTETTTKRGCGLSSKETTNGGQDRRRDEYVFVRPSPLVRWCGGQIGFPSRQGDQRQHTTLSTPMTNRTWYLGYTGKCWQDRLQTRKGQEV